MVSLPLHVQTPIYIIAQLFASVNPVFCSAERCCRCEMPLLDRLW